MDRLAVIGLLAGPVTTSGFVPQVIKGYRSGSMSDVSLFMPLLFMVGMILWLIYGVFLGDLPVVPWNGMAIILSSVLMALKVRSARQKRKGAEPRVTR